MKTLAKTLRRPRILASMGLVAVGISLAIIVVSLHKAKERSAVCLANLKRIGLATELYKNDFSGFSPTNFTQLAIYLSDTPEVIICPSDADRIRVTSRSPRQHRQSARITLDTNSVSYRIVATNAGPITHMGDVFLRCPFHGHVLYTDGYATTAGGRFATTEASSTIKLPALLGDAVPARIETTRGLGIANANDFTPKELKQIKKGLTAMGTPVNTVIRTYDTHGTLLSSAVVGTKCITYTTFSLRPEYRGEGNELWSYTERASDLPLHYELRDDRKEVLKTALTTGETFDLVNLVTSRRTHSEFEE
jgi:hypothetical protein